ncbi:MAG: Brp/Blh family beta-carotene 15,15'-dioxygenase [Parvibaculales bacterium]
MEAALFPLLVITLLGVPHGAADGVFAARAKLVSSPQQKAFFYTGYLAISAAVIFAWLMFPMTGLILFLSLSVVHFGLGDARSYPDCPQPYLRAFLHGGAVILLIPVFHAEMVYPVFSVLGGPEIQRVEGYVMALGAVWGVAMSAYTLLYASKRTAYAMPLAEIAGLAACFYLLPPLWGFAVYFCLVHSPRHFWRLFRDFGADEKPVADIIQILTLSAFTITAILVAAQMLPDLDYANNLLRSVFIGLAALTVPHMLLVDGLPVLRPKHN